MKKIKKSSAKPLTRAIFLDRDGTINFNAEYIKKPSDVTLLQNTIEGLRILQKAGFLLIIITNQSGIARGYFTEQDLKKVNNRLFDLLKKDGIRIDDLFFSPYLKNGKIKKYSKESSDRKPGTGMILKAAKKHGIDLRSSYMIGDSEADIKAGISAKCEATILIDPKKKGIDVFGQNHVAKDLLEAAVWIDLHEKGKKVVSRNQLDALMRKLRHEKKSVVFSNGAFDLIHPGHVNYLDLCKKLGDVLIIGLNSDDSIKNYKGEKRPINPEQTRIDMLTALPSVDYITVFDEKDPCTLINIIKPDIHIKDDQYTVEQIIEYDDVVKNKGKVVQLPRIKNYSTTNIIEAIRQKA